MITVSPKELQGMALDLLAQARSGDYPVDVDPGTDAGAKLAVLAMLTRVAGNRTDIGADALLHIAEETFVPGLCSGTLSADEAVTAADVVLLARRGSLEDLHDRAIAWEAMHDVADTLAALSVGIQLLQYIDKLRPGVLDEIVWDIEQFTPNLEQMEDYS
jgi:hypothetical protein